MTALPTRTDRMPQSTEEMLPVEHVIALALNSVAHEWWKHGRVSETSEPVRAVIEGLRLAGYEVRDRGLVK